MEYEPNKEEYNNEKNSSIDQHSPSYPTKEVDRSYSIPSLPPPYTEVSQKSVSDIRCRESDAQNDDQTPSYQQQITDIVFANKLTIWKPVITPVTRKLRIVYIITGIFYMLWASVSIGLEIMVMMYSYSTFYQGLWLSGILIGIGIISFMSACQISHYMVYIIYLSTFALFSIFLGAALSFHDVHVKIPGQGDFHPTSRESKIERILRWSFAGELSLASLQCAVFTIYIIHLKSISKVPPPPTIYARTVNNTHE